MPLPEHFVLVELQRRGPPVGGGDGDWGVQVRFSFGVRGKKRVREFVPVGLVRAVPDYFVYFLSVLGDCVVRGLLEPVFFVDGAQNKVVFGGGSNRSGYVPKALYGFFTVSPSMYRPLVLRYLNGQVGLEDLLGFFALQVV